MVSISSCRYFHCNSEHARSPEYATVLPHQRKQKCWRPHPLCYKHVVLPTSPNPARICPFCEGKKKEQRFTSRYLHETGTRGAGDPVPAVLPGATQQPPCLRFAEALGLKHAGLIASPNPARICPFCEGKKKEQQFTSRYLHETGTSRYLHETGIKEGWDPVPAFCWEPQQSLHASASQRAHYPPLLPVAKKPILKWKFSKEVESKSGNTQMSFVNKGLIEGNSTERCFLLSNSRLRGLLQHLRQTPDLLHQYDTYTIIKDQVSQGIVEPVTDVDGCCVIRCHISLIIW